MKIPLRRGHEVPIFYYTVDNILLHYIGDKFFEMLFYTKIALHIENEHCREVVLGSLTTLICPWERDFVSMRKLIEVLVLICIWPPHFVTCIDITRS